MRYHPRKEWWESLRSVPWNSADLELIIGHAVFDDFVLFDISYRGIWAFCIRTDKWYQVDATVKDGDPISIAGVGCVVENKTLYCLKFVVEREGRGQRIVQVLSVRKEEKKDGMAFTCRLRSQTPFPVSCEHKYSMGHDSILVHFGNKEFCLLTIYVIRSLKIERQHRAKVDIVLFIHGKDNNLILKKAAPLDLPFLDDIPVMFCPAFGFSLPPPASLLAVPAINSDPNLENHDVSVAGTTHSKVQPVDANATCDSGDTASAGIAAESDDQTIE
jgi:hypothetical protein